ncbi:MAG: hypothetical protein WBV39_15845, partial [Rudaea sp.]
YDTSILPWIAKKGPIVIDSGNESHASTRLIFGPIYSKVGISPSIPVHDRSGEGYPTTIAVRTDPVSSGVVTEAKLYLDVNRNGTPEFISDFMDTPDVVDCSIDGLTVSKTWRANLPPNIGQLAAGRVDGYLYFKGSPAAGEARRYIAIDMVTPDFAWLTAPPYSEREIEYSAGGQRVGVFAIDDTANAQVDLGHDPPAEYQIGRLDNRTDNTRMISMYRNNDGSDVNNAPLEGAHKEAGHNGSPTMVDVAQGVQYGPHVTTLIDQSFPLFYYVWGVPVLAGIEVGADFSLLAQIETSSRFSLMSNKQPVFEMTTAPSLDLGLNFYLDLDVLFDLVDGGVDLAALFDLKMPIKIEPEHPDPIISTCFTSSLTLYWHFEVFCLPFDFICDEFNDIKGQKELLNGQNGTGCAGQSPIVAGDATRSSSRIASLHLATAYSPSGAGFAAFTRDDSSGGAPPVLVVRPIDGGDFGRANADVILSSAPGIRSVDVEFYQDHRAIVVWAESDLDYPALAQLTPASRLAHQHLMYALFDGEHWAAKSVLTNASGGEGGVDLAPCLAEVQSACPSEGELLATWTRDMAGDITQHRTRVYTSRYVPARGWTTPMPVDANALLDSAPSAAYVDGNPVVAFVRSTTGNFGDTNSRRIAYRFVTGAGNTVQVPAELPGGVAWPNIIGLDGGRFAIAHTYASNAQAFVGNTQRVALVNASDCTAGQCAIAAQEVTDSHGRPIFGEHPIPLLDAHSNVTVVMRGLGFGVGSNGSNTNPADPIGMAMHTGDLISFAVNPQRNVVVPQPLSTDGAGNFAPAAAFDRALGQLVAMSTRGPAIPGTLRSKYLASGAEPASSKAMGVVVDPDLLAFSAVQGVDFAIEQVLPQSPTVVPGASFQVDTVVRNAGVDYFAAPLAPAYLMRLSWDAPYDAGGVPAGVRNIPPLDAGQASTLSVTVSVPAGFGPDQPHRLYASVFRNGNPVEDVQGSNDIAYTDLGGMPVPFGLSATAIPNTTLVQLTWEPIDDPQHLIAGYRVWCHDGDGIWRHLGSSFELGFLDVAAPTGVQRHYQVTTYSKNAIESLPSPEAITDGEVSDRLFANGFE